MLTVKVEKGKSTNRPMVDPTLGIKDIILTHKPTWYQRLFGKLVGISWSK